MSNDAASSRVISMPSALRKPARCYEKPTLVKTDSIIAITAITTVSPPT
jgi:hypothetical protein